MRNLIVASVVAFSMAGAAHAQDMFAFMAAPQDEGSSIIVINPLSASSDGFIAIYDHHNAQVGALLGVAAVREGANDETRVQLGRPVTRDVIALLFAGDEFSDPTKALDSVEIDIED